MADATEMTPLLLEILNRPSAVESVKQCGGKQHLIGHIATTVVIKPEGGRYNLRCCRL